MATFIIINQIFFSLFLIFHVILAIPQDPISQNALLLHVSKDPSTLQYVTKVSIDKDSPLSTPPVNLVLDLSSSLLWLDCESAGVSLSSLKLIQCCSLECFMASQNLCDCTWSNESQSKNCDVHVENPITTMAAAGELTDGFVSFDGGWFKKGTVFNTVRSNFLFSCAKTPLLKGLGSGVKGILGLGNSRVSLPLQAAKNLGFSRKFALCLSSSNGVIISGESPYGDISRTLLYTPLSFSNKGEHLGYNINVKSIKINGKKLALNQEGLGSTIISTTVAYTSMGSRIYDIFTKAYIKAAKDLNFTMVSAVKKPFEVCFSSRGFKTGTNVPTIDLVLQSEIMKWRINGRNSMVHVNDEVMCLGFVNGGLNPKGSIVIGGYQLEDNFLEFNLETSMLGFSSSSLFKNQTICSNLRPNSMFFKDLS